MTSLDTDCNKLKQRNSIKMRFSLILAIALALLMQLVAANGGHLQGSQPLYGIAKPEALHSVAVAGSPPSGPPPRGGSPPPPRTTAASSSG